MLTSDQSVSKIFAMNTKTIPHPPSKDLFAKVKGGFVAQHTTLNKWCEANGIKRQNARKAFLGEWNGPSAAALRRRLVEAAGVSMESMARLEGGAHQVRHLPDEVANQKFATPDSSSPPLTD